MNKFAEIKYGKVAHIYETTRTLDEMRALFIPATLLVDVTNIDCAEGWKVDYDSGLDIPNFIAPKTILPPTQEENWLNIKNNLIKAVDNLLDRTVKERGYDNIAKCVTYEGDEDPIFNAEGTAAKKWRSKVYRKFYDILLEVEAGEREIPTVEELLAELPTINW